MHLFISAIKVEDYGRRNIHKESTVVLLLSVAKLQCNNDLVFISICHRKGKASIGYGSIAKYSDMESLLMVSLQRTSCTTIPYYLFLEGAPL